MNVLYGLLQPDEGEILVDGEPRDAPAARGTPSRPASAWCTSTSCWSRSSPSPRTSCSAPSRPRRLAGFLDRRRARARSPEVSERYGLPVDPDAVVEDLPVGVQQRVEIIKALSRDVELLILDEPTAVLTPQETDELLDVMRSLRGGRQVDRLHHPQAQRGQGDRRPDHGDPARHGRRHRRARRASEDELAALMVGRTVELTVDKDAGRSRARPVLEVAGLVVADDRGHGRSTASTWTCAPARCSASPACRATGRPSWSRPSWACGPCWPARSARRQRPASAGRTKQILRAGVGYVPEDRSVDGLVKDFTVAENLVLDMYDQPPFGAAARAAARTRSPSGAEERVDEFDIRTPSTEPPVGTLSGGNQQKVIVARELSRPLKLFVAAQPTRGVDVGSIEFIHSRIVARARRRHRRADRLQRAGRGAGAGRPDRGDVPRPDPRPSSPPDTPREELGLLMAGVTDQEASVATEQRSEQAGTTRPRSRDPASPDEAAARRAAQTAARAADAIRHRPVERRAEPARTGAGTRPSVSDVLRGNTRHRHGRWRSCWR